MKYIVGYTRIVLGNRLLELAGCIASYQEGTMQCWQAFFSGTLLVPAGASLLRNGIASFVWQPCAGAYAHGYCKNSQYFFLLRKIAINKDFSDSRDIARKNYETSQLFLFEVCS